MVSGEVAFGVGSLVFDAVGAKDVDQWKEIVQSALDAIPSVRNLSLTTPNISIFIDGEVTPYGESVELTPAMGLMTFDVTIPTRLQKQLLFGSSVGDVEEFNVLTMFSHDHPVTFVVCRGADNTLRNPAFSLAIVRDFLANEISKLNDSGIRIRTIGPSPFHADCYLVQGNGTHKLTDDLTFERAHSPGYDRLTFFYDPEKTASHEAVGKLVQYAAPEFAVFYSLELDRHMRSNRARLVEDLANRVADTYSKHGVIQYLKRIFSNKRDLLTLRLATLKFKLDSIREQRDATQKIEELYEERPPILLRKVLEGKTEDNYAEEVETASRVLELLDSQHSQEVQRFVSFCVSLLGVVVGALLGALLRK